MTDTTTAAAAAPETTVLENVGGPKIPGGPGPKAPNMQGVPQEQAVTAAAPTPGAEPPAFDVEALAAALAKHGKPEAAEPQAEAQTELATTGNPAIDAGIAMLKQVSKLNDADMVRAIGKAVEYNDPNLIDSAFIKERFGEHAQYAELLAKAYLDDQIGQAQRAVTAAYDLVGGKENWETASQLFNAKAPEHVRAAARALANSGDVTGAAKLVVETVQGLGLIAKEAGILKGGAALDGALSAADFSKEYQALRKEAGNRSLESPKFAQRYQNLLSRRQAGKAKGI
ncbi:scaffolding protein [Enterobacter phage SDFMU_Pec]|uniref:Scaffolding protein n=1 Tax=Enterobacter phage SDFMU_Pec TaxID=3076136 RepID=A0AA96R100_9CAUD|nr:scaffolding protein [Enterobacter phage SDFMU_Pec]